MGLFLISTVIMLGLLYLAFYAKWEPNIMSSFVILITIYLVFWGLCTYSHFSSFDYEKYKLEYKELNNSVVLNDASIKYYNDIKLLNYNINDTKKNINNFWYGYIYSKSYSKVDTFDISNYKLKTTLIREK